jgi:hypothetical protein
MEAADRSRPNVGQPMACAGSAKPLLSDYAGASVIAPRLAVDTLRMYFASRPRV